MLFNDILVVAKPIIPAGIHATLDMKFVVKSVVRLDKLQITGFDTAEVERHPVVKRFIAQFARDPIAACKYLVERSSPKVDSATLASLIFKTPELDRRQVGAFLSSDVRVLRAYVDRFHLRGIRIDDALRIFLLSIQLESDVLLQGFAERYAAANEMDQQFVMEVVWAMMQLNDTPRSLTDFKNLIRSSDPLLDDEMLADIYDSIQTMPLNQAANSVEERPVAVTMRSKVTIGAWSEMFSVSIPAPDPEFRVRLLGDGLEFDPPVLDFLTSRAFFRVKGSALGTRTVLFDRIGPNA